jgi:ABC-type spermidine/putrescine transport system permease subunit I
MGYLIQEQMLGKNNWPMAAAFSVVLVTGVACVIMLTRLLMAKRIAFHE